MSSAMSVTQPRSGLSLRWIAILAAAAAFLSFFTVYDQIFHRTGIEFLLDDQIERHQRVLAGTAVDPWQYRIFSTVALEGVIRVLRAVGSSSVEYRAFWLMRLAQNMILFIVAAAYWRAVGLSRWFSLLGLALLAWGISYSGFGSGLAFDTFFDLIFYLLAGFFILRRQFGWLVLIMLIAPLNRETSGLIPFLVLASAVRFRPKLRVEDRGALIAGMVGAFIFVLEMAALRLFFGPRPAMTPYGIELGWPLVIYNLTNRQTLFSLASTFSFIPFLALAFWSRWPELLRRFFWVTIPVWLLLHLPLAVLAEARVLLVPHVLIFLPAALIALEGGGHEPG